MINGFKCMSCKSFMKLPYGYKWKDKTRMVKISVCQTCYDKSRSLKANLNGGRN